MRRTHDPSGLGGRGPRLRRHPQHQPGRAGSLRGQCQLAAGDKVELPRLTPDLQHDRAHRIAGKCIGRRSQGLLDVGGVDADETTRIETEFGKTVHRHSARFDFGEILPDPDHRTPLGHAPGNAGDKPGRHRALPSGLCKHLVYGAQSEPALQARIRIRMAKRHLSQTMRRAMRLEALDAVAQRRKISGADLMFALLPAAISYSEHQIQSSTKILKLRVVL